MQDRYTGDIGDFGKCGLLRHISKTTKLKIGLNWYLVPNESGNSDGKHISYLIENKDNDKRFKQCDPELYEALQDIVQPEIVEGEVISKGKRKITKLESSKILPGVIFYSDRLSFVESKNIGNEAKRNERLKLRNSWVKRGFDKLKGCHIVLFDPDNGFPVYNVKEQGYTTEKHHKKGYTTEKHHKKGIKYIYYDEIIEYYNRGQSLIIYQHRDRKKQEEYLNRFRRIRDFADEANHISYMRFRAYSVRDYVFVLQNCHKAEIDKSLKEMLNRPWGKGKLFESPIEL